MKGDSLGDFRCLRKTLTAKPTLETEEWRGWMGDREAELRKRPALHMAVDQSERGAWDSSPALF